MLLRALVAAFALVSSSTLWAAEPPRLKLPDFSHLQSKAVESVDITIGPTLLWFAKHFVPERDEDGAEVRKVLGGIKEVYVRSFQFADDNAYSKADIDAVRNQLRDEKWQPLAQIQSRKKEENVDIFIAIQDDKPTGFAILASDPREFTIVNIVGTIDPEDIGKLRASLDLPRSGSRRDTIND